MKKLTIISIAVLGFALSSCRKDKDSMEDEVPASYIKLEPLSYYPIYPGSYWKYVVNDTDTVTSSASAAYLLHSYIEHKGDQTFGPSTPVYVPFLDNQPVYQYDRIEHLTTLNNQNADYYQRTPVLSEQVGFKFNRENKTTKFGDFNEHVKVEAKTVNAAGDSILILQGHWVWGPNAACKTTQIFTKNIGLTYSIKVDTIKNDTIQKSRLLDYHINH